jgi:hypothetical protein
MAEWYAGLFTHGVDGSLARHPQPPLTLRDPETGRDLRIATVEVAGAICPSCTQHAQAGFVSFVADLRMVFACPHCRQLVWLNGA